MIKILDTATLNKVVQNNQHITKLREKLKLMMRFDRGLLLGSNEDPHVASVKKATNNSKFKLAAGFIIYKDRKDNDYNIQQHSFLLNDKDKVIETSNMYDWHSLEVIYVGVVIPEEDYKTYLKYLTRVDYIKKLSPLSLLKL